MNHQFTRKSWDYINTKIHETICSCGWRGPSIKTHYFESLDDCYLAEKEHVEYREYIEYHRMSPVQETYI